MLTSCETLLTSDAFRWASDLYDAGYYWEAHEAWEQLWKLAVGRDEILASFLKALIKLSAAAVKAREGRVVGVRRHAGRAEELLRLVRSHSQGDASRDTAVEKLIDCSLMVASQADRMVERGQRDTQAVLFEPLPW